ncbi:hypothetical protein EV424DRAFT_1353897 [Suillus variegatus]|nr:hypothetical protein EV424DRAFT_1353897 [Suillus variegatus]
MNKLKESESGLKLLDPSSSAPSADSLEALLSQFGNEGEEEMQGVLEAMMGQLMGKDILCEPLKELSDKIISLKQLLENFESKDYADDDDKTRLKIVNLMGKLQKHGSPPEEIMGSLPPGLSMGADSRPNMLDRDHVSILPTPHLSDQLFALPVAPIVISGREERNYKSFKSISNYWNEDGKQNPSSRSAARVSLHDRNSTFT